MPKTLFVSDFDDTLAQTDAKIIITKASGEVVEMDPPDYAVYTPEPGDKFDFSEFEQLKNPRPIQRFVKLLKNAANNKNVDKVSILTARGHTRPVAQFLKMMGVTSGVSIAAIGSSDPQKKADYIEKHIKDGYDRIAFIDDSPKNVQAVKKLRDTYPEVKILIHQAKEHPEESEPKKDTKQDVDVRPLETQNELSQAKEWIMKQHYIGRWPSAVQAKLGVYIGGKLKGVLLYGATIRPQSGTELFKNDQGQPIMQNNQMWELLRAYTTEDAKKEVANLGSMVIAKGNDYIRTKAKTKDGKQVKAILTYADADVGHTGGVYKATNATYLGKQKPLPVFIVRDPKTDNEYELRTLTSLGKKKLEDRGLEVTKRMGAGKHKYVYPLGKDQKERDELMSQLSVPMYDYPTGADNEQPKQIPNQAKERVAKKQKQPQQTSKSAGTTMRDFFQTATVKNPDTGEDILVRSALKYDKQSKAYMAAKHASDEFAKKNGISLG
jgi:hypothetical protein